MARANSLVINPNSNPAVTAGLDAALATLRLYDGPSIRCATLAEGPFGIETQKDVEQVTLPLRRMVEQDNAADAFVIACFSDPGLLAVREAARRPVMGIAECGILRALTLGERFGIIALSDRSVQRQQRYVRQMGVSGRYAGSVPVEATAEETAGDAVQARLAAAGRRLVEAFGADVLVLGCAGMAGHQRALEDVLGRPVVEPTQQAVIAALGAVLLSRC